MRRHPAALCAIALRGRLCTVVDAQGGLATLPPAVRSAGQLLRVRHPAADAQPAAGGVCAAGAVQDQAGAPPARPTAVQTVSRGSGLGAKQHTLPKPRWHALPAAHRSHCTPAKPASAGAAHPDWLADFLKMPCCARPLPHPHCHRCQDLSNGAMIPAVADFAQTAGGAVGQAAAVTGFEGKRLLTPEQLRASLK